MNIHVKKLLVLCCLAVALFGCEGLLGIFGQDDEDTPTPVLPPPVVSPEEALALLRLDEHPVRSEDEVTVVVEDFLSDVAKMSGTDNAPVITDVEAYVVTVERGFAVKSPDSDTELVPETSTLPFYRYAVADTTVGTTGIIIASGDKRVGGIIAYIEGETDDPAAEPFMDILADCLDAYVDRVIDDYNSITPEKTESAAQTLSQRTSQKFASLRSAGPDGKPIKGTDFYPLIQTNRNQSTGYWEVVNNRNKTPDPRVVYNDGGIPYVADGLLLPRNETSYGFYVGCVAVAMGQIMAFHEWPGRCSLPGILVHIG
jgi:hypothetical protein